MKTYLNLFIFNFFYLGSFGQINKDTTLSKNQSFAYLGSSIIGYTPAIESYFSIYFTTGLEYNVSKKIKYGASFSWLKFSWIGLKNDSETFGGHYDKVRYFSWSTDAQIFSRYIINRQNDNQYDKYIELGMGYNAPIYFSLDKFIGDKKQSETYPNNYNDLYFYSSFFLFKPIKLPIGMKLEYHPFDIIKNDKYPNLAPFRFDLMLNLFSENNDKK